MPPTREAKKIRHYKTHRTEEWYLLCSCPKKLSTQFVKTKKQQAYNPQLYNSRGTTNQVRVQIRRKQRRCASKWEHSKWQVIFVRDLSAENRKWNKKAFFIPKISSAIPSTVFSASSCSSFAACSIILCTSPRSSSSCFLSDDPVPDAMARNSSSDMPFLLAGRSGSLPFKCANLYNHIKNVYQIINISQDYKPCVKK